MLRKRCAAQGCPERVKQAHNRYCSKRCAWLARRGWEMGARGRQKALAVNRARFIARLKARLGERATASQVWKAGYAAGYRAAYAGYLRKLQRGDLVLVRERRCTWAA